jgi:Kunitz/Bovine pancreatic trypsin inhibitor domain
MLSRHRAHITVSQLPLCSRSCIFQFLLVASFTACGGSTQISAEDAGGAAGSVEDAAAEPLVESDATLPAVCSLPQQVGPCDAFVPSYWHNPATGVCEPFVYGGCQGNANRFASLAECQSACHGGVINMDACGAPTDCTLASVGCCGACDPVDARAFVVLNRSEVDRYIEIKGCTGVACGPCQDVLPLERTRQYFVATCAAAECALIDVRESELTTCQQSSDCVLRLGAECCERCSGDGVVALSKDARLQDLVCGDAPVGCPPCQPIISPAFAPSCANGRCVVTMAKTP